MHEEALSFYTLRSINYLNLILAFRCAFKFSQNQMAGPIQRLKIEIKKVHQETSGSYISCDLILHLMGHLATRAALIGSNSAKIGR